MKFFIDTAHVDEIRQAKAMGLLDGVTTNPSLVAKTGRPMRQVLEEICSITDRPVSAEVLATETEAMVDEARSLAEIADNIVVKIPMTVDGMRAVRQLEDEGIHTNVTLVFSPLQALMAAKAGASYVSPFVGRLDDIGHTGMELVEQILEIFDAYELDTEVIVASVRSPGHVLEGALMGAHIATIPFAVIGKLAKHCLTDAGLERFLADAQTIPGDGGA